MPKQRNWILNIWFAYIIFYVCFKHFFVNDTFLYLIMDGIFLMLMPKLIYKKVGVKRNIWWIYYFILAVNMLFSIVYALSFVDAVKFTLLYFNFMIITFCFLQFTDWEFIFYKWIKVGCFFHLAFTYFSVFFTEKALNISKYFLTNEAQQLTVLWSSLHRYAGISGQVGINAFFFTLLIGLLLAELRSDSKDKGLNRMLFVSSWIGLILTGKKELFIAAMLSMVAIFWITGDREEKKKLILIINISACMLLFVCIIFYSQIYDLFHNSVSTRIELINGMLAGIEQRPLMGHGVNSIGKFTYDNNLGHNIYLQMWVEQGIIGLIILITALFSALYLTYIKTKRAISSIKNQISIYFSLFMQLFIIIYGCFGNPIYDYNILITYFLTVAAGFVVDRKLVVYKS